MDTKREAQIERQIEKVKRDLTALGDLRPGSLSTQFNVCGSPGCRCKATPPEKHGPYYQVSFTRKGKSRSPTRVVTRPAKPARSMWPCAMSNTSGRSSTSARSSALAWAKAMERSEERRVGK